MQSVPTRFDPKQSPYTLLPQMKKGESVPRAAGYRVKRGLRESYGSKQGGWRGFYFEEGELEFQLDEISDPDPKDASGRRICW